MAKGPGLYSDIGKKARDPGLSVETLSSLTKLSREGVKMKIPRYDKLVKDDGSAYTDLKELYRYQAFSLESCLSTDDGMPDNQIMKLWENFLEKRLRKMNEVVGKKYVRLYPASLYEQLYPHEETMLHNSSQEKTDATRPCSGCSRIIHRQESLIYTVRSMLNTTLMTVRFHRRGSQRRSTERCSSTSKVFFVIKFTEPDKYLLMTIFHHNIRVTVLSSSIVQRHEDAYKIKAFHETSMESTRGRVVYKSVTSNLGGDKYYCHHMTEKLYRAPHKSCELTETNGSRSLIPNNLATTIPLLPPNKVSDAVSRILHLRNQHS